jgi:hypothetical protein
MAYVEASGVYRVTLRLLETDGTCTNPIIGYAGSWPPPAQLSGSSSAGRDGMGRRIFLANGQKPTQVPLAGFDLQISNGDFTIVFQYHYK